MGKITQIDIDERLSASLSQKEWHFFSVMDAFYHKYNGEVYIAFSGGKDSTVMVHLADKWCKLMGYNPIQLVFNNTTNEFSEILDFVRKYGDRVTWLRPKMTFAQSLQKNGFPLVSKEQAQRISEAKNTNSEKLRDIRMNGVMRKAKTTGKEYKSGAISEKWKYLVFEDIEVTSKCCDILKKAPVKKFEKETGLRPIIGTTIEESVLRKQQYIKSGGCNDFNGNRPKSRPLSIFTEQDIWNIIERDSIEICPVYYDQEINGEIVDGEKRTGCAYCAFGVQYEEDGNTKFHRLQKREPKRFNSFMNKLGYAKALSLVGVEFNDI